METQEPFPNRLCEVFEAERDILHAEIKKAGGEFTHGGLKGTSGEQIAKDFLRRYTPSPYGFANGQIIDSKENISKEVDVAICNPTHPLTYGSTGRGVFFAESVDAVIEVKSTIQDLDALKSHCKSVRDCHASNRLEGTQQIAAVPFDRVDKTPYAVFAFSSNIAVNTISERLNEWNEQDRYFIDLLFILDEGLVVYNYQNMDLETDQVPTPDIEEGEYGISPFKPALLMFLVHLSDKMPDIDASINPLSVYFDRSHQE